MQSMRRFHQRVQQETCGAQHNEWIGENSRFVHPFIHESRSTEFICSLLVLFLGRASPSTRSVRHVLSIVERHSTAQYFRREWARSQIRHARRIRRALPLCPGHRMVHERMFPLRDAEQGAVDARARRTLQASLLPSVSSRANRVRGRLATPTLDADGSPPCPLHHTRGTRSAEGGCGWWRYPTPTHPSTTSDRFISLSRSTLKRCHSIS